MFNLLAQAVLTVLIGIYGAFFGALYLVAWIVDAVLRLLSRGAWQVKMFFKRRISVFVAKDDSPKRAPRYVGLSGKVSVKSKTEHKASLADDRKL